MSWLRFLRAISSRDSSLVTHLLVLGNCSCDAVVGKSRQTLKKYSTGERLLRVAMKGCSCGTRWKSWKYLRFQLFETNPLLNMSRPACIQTRRNPFTTQDMNPPVHKQEVSNPYIKTTSVHEKFFSGVLQISVQSRHGQTGWHKFAKGKNFPFYPPRLLHFDCNPRKWTVKTAREKCLSAGRRGT